MSTKFGDVPSMENYAMKKKCYHASPAQVALDCQLSPCIHNFRAIRDNVCQLCLLLHSQCLASLLKVQGPFCPIGLASDLTRPRQRSKARQHASFVGCSSIDGEIAIEMGRTFTRHLY